MSTFDDAFVECIGLEGGYVNDPDDRGGETKYGIAKRWHKDVDIKGLTLEGAKQIYWREYWNPLLLAQLMPRVAIEVFEQAINMGRRQGVLHLQQSLTMLGEQLSEDGMIGGQTILAANRTWLRYKETLLKAMNGFQFIRYLEIVKGDPSQKKYFVGWLRRVA